MSQTTWEQAIIGIRNNPEYADLIDNAYFHEDLERNVQQFRSSEEFRETLSLIKSCLPASRLKVLDIGAGNGVSSVAFALEGFSVTAVEPDRSNTVGAGAIQQLKNTFNLRNLAVIGCYAEMLPFKAGTFDLVYARQAMHHAHNLEQFVQAAYNVLKKSAIFLTVRDHVIYNEVDKQLFLDTHPLHKFYGGENAFTMQEYRNSFKTAGFKTLVTLGHFDSVINYFPMTQKEYEEQSTAFKQKVIGSLSEKIGHLARIPLIANWYLRYNQKKYGRYYDESKVAGRLYTFVNKKIR
jgi:SAM-dependent methyltransferase